ncbi:SGNH/GDSL hydrolase family protein [Deinococcus maricopensis]|uniref:Uncharacterized protein n=1 Tax=Deinococcus maricopensis (strain DSM 21211 / LMG 22137 / NRRL B-23946 / LB-34) TaxID=709986 RepID=E8U6R9_DEIML|nr:SGNH/GDSL hydrolase family protein [Deinococcus maricopensis]ADV66758.1 hypothetical protein Deima_1105 [Deinococcus maricopensis DSM 21211]
MQSSETRKLHASSYAHPSAPAARTRTSSGMHFLAAVLGWTFAFSAALAGVVWFVDPRGEFGRDQFPKVTLDARRQKMQLFEAYNTAAPVQALILGSSRTMKLDPRAFEQRTGLRFFNFTVDAARAEGYLAVYRWARAQGAPVRRVLVGLDVEALHDDDVPFVNHRNNGALRAMIEPGPTALVQWSAQVSRLKGLFTAAYLQDTARVVLASARDTAGVPAMQFTGNGYLQYPRWEAQQTRGTFDLKAEVDACLPAYLNRYRTMRGLSAQRWAYLETLVREVQADGGQVDIWISPLHPDTAALLRRETRYAALLAETRAHLQGLARRTGVRVADYSAPQRFGADAQDWFDCAHLDNRGAALLTDHLLSTEGRRGL